MAKCLIAGLPAAGKTTYIAALSYLLHNPTERQKLSLREVPNDMSVINRLQNPWLGQRAVDRTSRGKVTNFEFKLTRNADAKNWISICQTLQEKTLARCWKNSVKL